MSVVEADHRAISSSAQRWHRDGADGAPVLRWRVTIGGDEGELRCFTAERRSELAPTATLVRLIAPVSGRVSVTAGGQDYDVAPGQALVLAHPQKTDCLWPSGGVALVAHLHRVRIQAKASAMIGAPCRLAACTVLLPSTVDTPLGVAVANIRAGAARTVVQRLNDPMAPEGDLIPALIDALRKAEGSPGVFPIAGSVKRAVDHVRAQPERQASPAALAVVAGVTVATLRRNFKSCLGLSISGFTQQARLDWIRDRLRSPTESRPINQLAIDTGFATAGVMARAYQRRFGESPSLTRANAFMAARD